MFRSRSNDGFDLPAFREVVGEHGLFCALYTDRGSHYFETPKAGEKVSKTQLTQVGRALKQLGIEHIAAYSPEARGRSERLFRTLQDRLPKELRLAGIKDVEAANAWLRAQYMAEHNGLFAIAREEGTAFVATARWHGAKSCAWWKRLVGQRQHDAGAEETAAPPSRMRRTRKGQGAGTRLPDARSRRSWAHGCRYGERHADCGGRKRGIVLDRSRDGREGGARGEVRATATLDRLCARCPSAAMPQRLEAHVQRPCPRFTGRAQTGRLSQNGCRGRHSFRPGTIRPQRS